MENNFISCQAKYGKLYDNFSTHFKVATNMKMRCFKKKKKTLFGKLFIFWKMLMLKQMEMKNSLAI